jgi:hypothetical protein
MSLTDTTPAMRAMSVSFFHHRRMLVGSAIVLGIVVLSATLAGWGPLALARRLLVWAVEFPILQERSATERDLPQFTHLAAGTCGSVISRTSQHQAATVSRLTTA